MEIIKAIEEKNIGLTRYFSGKPCRHGHITQRMVSSHSCCECLRIRRPRYDRSYNPSRAKLYDSTSQKRTPSYRKLKRHQLLEIVAGRPKPNICEVCQKAASIVFDHCHLTDKFRGWICISCNIALGMVKNSPSVLRSLADYLDFKLSASSADKIKARANRVLGKKGK